MTMNATNLLTVLLFATACTSVNANDAPAKPAAPAKAAEAKPAEVKPADAKAAEAKPADSKPADSKPAAESKQADAKPVEDAKLAADTTAEAPAKPAPKKKKPVKKAAKKPVTKDADAHAPAGANAAAGHAAPDANGDKVPAQPDVHVAPVAAAIEPSKRLKLKKVYPGGTPVGADAHAADSQAAHEDHAPAQAAPAAAPAAAQAHAAAPPPAPAPTQAAAAPAPAPAAASAAADTHVAYSVSAEPQVSKRFKPKASIAGATAAPAADSHSPKADHVAAAEEHATPPAAAHDDHSPVAADTHAPAAAPAPVAAKALPAHTGHGPISVSTARAAAEECDLPLKSEIAALFDRWNNSLRTGDPRKVVANYAPNSILLPTVSNRARFTIAEKEEYFMHFLMRRPEGSIDDRMIEVDCNSATDAGLYTFRFADGTKVKARYSFSYKKVGAEWLISSHHSSAMPERAEPVVEAHAAHAVHAPAPAAAPVAKAVPGRPGEAPDASTKGWVRYP